MAFTAEDAKKYFGDEGQVSLAPYTNSYDFKHTYGDVNDPTFDTNLLDIESTPQWRTNQAVDESFEWQKKAAENEQNMAETPNIMDNMTPAELVNYLNKPLIGTSSPEFYTNNNNPQTLNQKIGYLLNQANAAIADTYGGISGFLHADDTAKYLEDYSNARKDTNPIELNSGYDNLDDYLSIKGLGHDLANLGGSMAALAPVGVIGGELGIASKGLQALATRFPTLARVLSLGEAGISKLPKGLQDKVRWAGNYATAKAIPESMSEGGQVRLDLLDNNPNHIDPTLASIEAALENYPLLAASDMVEGATLGRGAFNIPQRFMPGFLGKSTVGRVATAPLRAVPNMAFNGLSESTQEALQEAISAGAKGGDYGVLPWNWTDEQGKAFRSTLLPASILGLAGGSAHATRGSNNKRNNDVMLSPELQAQMANVNRAIMEGANNAGNEFMAPMLSKKAEPAEEKHIPMGTDAVLSGAAPYMGVRMDNGANGCVEAVTKIGAQMGSPFLSEQLRNGVVYVPTLVQNAGDRVIPFDPSQLEAGDIIVYGDNDHVVMYDGQGGYVGNSSSQQQVVHGGDYNSMSGLQPTKIIKNDGNSGASAPSHNMSAADAMSRLANSTDIMNDFISEAVINGQMDREALAHLLDAKGNFKNTEKNRKEILDNNEELFREYLTDLVNSSNTELAKRVASNLSKGGNLEALNNVQQAIQNNDGEAIEMVSYATRMRANQLLDSMRTKDNKVETESKVETPASVKNLLDNAGSKDNTTKNFYRDFVADRMASIDDVNEINNLSSMLNTKGKLHNTPENRQALAKAYPQEIEDYYNNVYAPRHGLTQQAQEVSLEQIKSIVNNMAKVQQDNLPAPQPEAKQDNTPILEEGGITNADQNSQGPAKTATATEGIDTENKVQNSEPEQAETTGEVSEDDIEAWGEKTRNALAGIKDKCINGKITYLEFDEEREKIDNQLKNAIPENYSNEVKGRISDVISYTSSTVAEEVRDALAEKEAKENEAKTYDYDKKGKWKVISRAGDNVVARSTNWNKKTRRYENYEEADGQPEGGFQNEMDAWNYAKKLNEQEAQEQTKTESQKETPSDTSERPTQGKSEGRIPDKLKKIIEQGKQQIEMFLNTFRVSGEQETEREKRYYGKDVADVSVKMDKTIENLINSVDRVEGITDAEKKILKEELRKFAKSYKEEALNKIANEVAREEAYQKMKEDKAIKKKEEAEKLATMSDFNGFMADASNMTKGKIRKFFEKKISYKGKVISRKEFVEQVVGKALKNGGKIEPYTDKGKTAYRAFIDSNNGFVDLQKTEYEYAKYLEKSERDKSAQNEDEFADEIQKMNDGKMSSFEKASLQAALEKGLTKAERDHFDEIAAKLIDSPIYNYEAFEDKGAELATWIDGEVVGKITKWETKFLVPIKRAYEKNEISLEEALQKIKEETDFLLNGMEKYFPNIADKQKIIDEIRERANHFVDNFKKKAQKKNEEKSTQEQAKAEEAKNSYNGFINTLPASQQARAQKTLSVKVDDVDGKKVTRAEYVEKAVADDRPVHKVENGKKTEYRIYTGDDTNSYAKVTKTEYDYAMYLGAKPLDVEAPAETETKSEEKAEPKDEAKETTKKKSKKSSDKLEDFGEHLEGAKKDYYASYKDKMEQAAKENLGDIPLSKWWPEPNYQKLLDNGVSKDVVNFIRALRDIVSEIMPDKRNWKYDGWKTTAEFARKISNNALNDGNFDTTFLNISPELKGMIKFKELLYDALGHEKSLKGYNVDVITSGTIFYYPTRDSESIPYEATSQKPVYRFRSGKKVLEYLKINKELRDPSYSIDEIAEKAIQAIKEGREENATGDKKSKKPMAKISVGRLSGSSTYMIFVKWGSGNRWSALAEGFETPQEARNYLEENREELYKKYEDLRKTPKFRGETNSARIGKDYRNGKDVTPEQFSEAFGFRGVQFGNWVKNAKRQQDLNEAFDALMDLADVLGISPRALSLGGELGLAFGARGSGNANAHYEPTTFVINLTNTRGAGSLAHEWFHALDNYLTQTHRSLKPSYMTHAYHSEARKELEEAVKELRKAFSETGYLSRSSMIDALRSNDYWSTNHEMGARAFEAYVIYKLKQAGYQNDYLANVRPQSEYDESDKGKKDLSRYPYPTNEEMENTFAEAFDNLFTAIEEKSEGGNVVLYSLSDSSVEAMSPEDFEQAVKDEFSYAKDFTKKNNVISFVLPNGKKIHVDLVNRIAFTDEDKAKAEQAYGREVKDNEAPEGAYTNAGEEGFISVAMTGNKGAISHEAYHVSREFLSDKAKDFLSSKFKNEEAEAETYRKWRDGRNRDGMFGKIWQQIKDVASSFANLLGIQTEHEIFRQIESGKVYENTAVNGKSQNTKYSLATEKQLEKVRKQYEGTDQWMKAPNGKPTNLTERQWLQVRTPNFKEWFGDWENDPKNASKIVDENGEPLVVYHGTPLGGFEEFNRELNYFTADKEYADRYQDPGASSDYVKGVHEELGEAMTYPVFLNIRKPFDTRNAKERKIFENEFYRQWGNGAPLSDKGLPDWTDSDDFREFFEENDYDYDGLLLDEGGVPDENGGVKSRGISYVAFKPNQIKSATENNGDFSKNSNNIKLSVANIEAQEAINQKQQLEIVKTEFPTATNVKQKDDEVSFNLNGQRVRVNFADKIIMTERDTVVYRQDYGKKYAGETVLGKVETINGEQVITLLKTGPKDTISHEAFHLAFRAILTNEQRKFLVKQYGSEEKAAEAYRELMNKGRSRKSMFDTNTKVGRLFQKIYDFAESIFKVFSLGSTQYDAESIMYAIADGSIYNLNEGKREQSAFIHPAYLAAWHGSPHKFYKFLLDKIGTGEGAQVHGYGLYFALDKNVAEAYRETLSAGAGEALYESIIYKGQLYNSLGEFASSFDSPRLEKTINNIANELYESRNADDFIKNFYDSLQKEVTKKSYKEQEIAEIKEIIEAIENGEFDYEAEFEDIQSSLYKVEIPELDTMLREDDSFSQQTKQVQKALRNLYRDNENVRKWVDDFANYIRSNNNSFKNESDNLVVAFDGVSKNTSKGRQFIINLEDILGSPKEVSLMLLNHGVQGISYHGGQDGECCVVFNDRAIKILERNGAPIESKPSFSVSVNEDNQVAAVRKKYEGTDKWMKAPNGKPTNLNEEQWLTVRTPAFKEWFGDWEANPKDASEVVDENGEPLVVYHGTPTGGFDVFDKNKIGSRGKAGRGYFSFTTNKEIAEAYSTSLDSVRFRKRIDILNEVLNDNMNQDLLKAWGLDDMVEEGNAIELDPDVLSDNMETVWEEDYDSTEEYKAELNRVENEFADSLFDEYSKLSEKAGYPEVATRIKNAKLKGVPSEKSEVKAVFISSKGRTVFTKETTMENYGKDATEGEYSGKDVVILKFDDGNTVVFTKDSNSIKSATDNIGTFSKDNDNIKLSISEQADQSSTEEIKQAVLSTLPKSVKVEDHGDTMTIHMPNDVTVDVEVVDNISVTDEELEQARKKHGIGKDVNITVNGKFKVTGAKRALISLARNGKKGTAYHEIFHLAYEMALTDAQKKGLDIAYGDKAKAAGKDIQEYLADKMLDDVEAKKNPPKGLQKVYEAITDMIDKLQRAILGKDNGRNIMHDIETGKVFENSVDKNKKADDNVGKETKSLAQRVGEIYLKDNRDPEGNGNNPMDEMFNNVLDAFEQGEQDKLFRRRMHTFFDEKTSDAVKDVLSVEVDFIRRCITYVERNRSHENDDKSSDIRGSNQVLQNGLSNENSSRNEGILRRTLNDEVLRKIYNSKPSPIDQNSVEEWYEKVQNKQSTLENKGAYSFATALEDGGWVYKVELKKNDSLKEDGINELNRYVNAIIAPRYNAKVKGRTYTFKDLSDMLGFLNEANNKARNVFGWMEDGRRTRRENNQIQLSISPEQEQAPQSFLEKIFNNFGKSDNIKAGKIIVEQNDKNSEQEEVNLKNYIFSSPSRIAEKVASFKYFYTIGKRAMDVLTQKRSNFERKLNKAMSLVDNKEDYKALSDVLLSGDMEGKEWTKAELIADGIKENVAEAYVQIRRLMDQAYKMVNEARRRPQTHTINNATEKQLQDLRDNDFVDILSIKEDKDGHKKVTYKEYANWERNYTVDGETLKRYQDDPAMQVVDIKQEGKGTYNVTVRESIPPVNKLTGYIPHFFHNYMVRVVDKDGNTVKDENGNPVIITSGRTEKEAVEKAEEWLKNNKLTEGETIHIAPKIMDFTSLGMDEGQYAAIMGDKDYYKMMNSIAEKNDMTLAEAKEMMDGSVRKKGRHRFFGNLMQRKGVKGYEEDINYILRHYFNSASRYYAMETEFKPKAINMYERLFGDFSKDAPNKTADYTKDYINDLNGNPTTLENAINDALMKSKFFRKFVASNFGDRAALQLASNITGATSYLCLGYLNASSALLNLTQLINTAAYVNDFAALGKGLAKGFHHKYNLGDLRILHETNVLNDIGLDSGSGYDMNRMSAKNLLGKLNKGGMVLFKTTEAYCRCATVLAAYESGRKKGMSHKEAIEYAKEINQKSNFDYGVADAPNIFRRGSILSQLMLQFKKYGIKELEVMGDMLPWNKATDGKQKVIFWGLMLLACGLLQWPGEEFLDNVFFDGKLKPKAKAWIMETMGDSPMGKALAEAAMYGLAAPVTGVDISSRAGLADVIPSKGRDLGGAAITRTVSLASDLFQGKWADALRDVSPGLYNQYAAWIAGQSIGKRNRVNNYYDSWYDKALRSIGFKSVEESIDSDIQRITSIRKKEATEEKQKAVDDYIENPTDENLKRLKELGVKPKTVKEERKKKKMDRLERNQSGMSKGAKKENKDLLQFAK